MVSAWPLAGFPVFVTVCSKEAGLRLGMALLYAYFDIAAKNPNVFLEIQILGALLVGLTLIRGDRHASFRDADLVEDRGVSLEIDVSGLRVHEYLLLAIASDRRGRGARLGQRRKQRDQR